jgi:hypothetical protein
MGIKMLKVYPKAGAVMWVGNKGEDRNQLRSEALHYARSLLCEHSARSGPLFDSNHHPDFKLLEPEQDNRWIKIDWIRELIDWSATKPVISPVKVAVLCPADAMNLQAANALLKTLEEPAANTLYLLVTEHPELLPATIQSRCQLVRHRTKPDEIGQDFMRVQVQNDLQALKTNQAEPTLVAGEWLKKDLHQVLYWLMIVLCEFTNKSQDEHVVKSRRWWRFMDEVFEVKRMFEERTQANIQLLIEALLIHYARIMTR